MNQDITIESNHIKEILRILTSIFPGVLIYYTGVKEHALTQDGKLPEIDVVLDLGRRIGSRDIDQAQKELNTTDLPYTVYLYDLQSVSEHERKEMLRKAIAWKLE